MPLDLGVYQNSMPGTVAAAGGGWWEPYVADVSAQDIKLARDCGVRVNVWGVESSDQAVDEVLRLNADAITLSDSPLGQSKLLQSNLGRQFISCAVPAARIQLLGEFS